jgi:hypothetical protein
VGKISFTINVTVGGYAYQERVIPHKELLDFPADYLCETGVQNQGRKTYQPLEAYWPKAQ